MVSIAKVERHQRQKSYSWNPGDYAGHSTEQQKWARELIGKLTLQGTEKILDIGSGDGKVTAELAAQVPRGGVIGIDSSEGMVRHAREGFPREKHGNLSFQRADARHLPFDGEFDIIFSNATLHWVIDHRPVLRGIARSLKGGGRLLLQMGGKGNAADMVAVVETVTRMPEWSGYFRDFPFPYGFHGPDEYRVWMEEAGLCPGRVELIPKDMVHKGKGGLAGWVRTTWLPYTERIPGNLRPAFVDDIVDRFAESHPEDADGCLHLLMVRLEVEGTKPARHPSFRVRNGRGP